MASILSVHYTKYDSSRLLPFTAKKETSNPIMNTETGQMETKEYFRITPEYKYEVKDAKTGKISDVIGPFKVKMCSLTTDCGITYRNSKLPKGKQSISREEWVKLQRLNDKNIINGKKKLIYKLGQSIPVRFDIADQDQRLLIGDIISTDVNGNPIDDGEEKIKGFYQQYLEDVARNLFAIKTLVKISAKNINGVETSFREGGPIYYKKDAVTDQVIAGSKASHFFGLLLIGNIDSNTRRETNFFVPIKDENGKFTKVDWEILSSVNMKFTPIVSFQSITVAGSMVDFQDYIDEAIIDKIAPAGDISQLTEDLEELSTNVTNVDSLKSQFEILKKIKAESNSGENLALALPPPPQEKMLEDSKSKLLNELNKIKDAEVTRVETTTMATATIITNSEQQILTTATPIPSPVKLTEEEAEAEEERRLLAEMKKNKRDKKNKE